MARFAPVAPIHILSKFQEMEILGEYHLLLAHDIIKPENRRGYNEIFGQRNWNGTVILDNSIIELGSAVSLDVIGEAAKIVQANVIVLPDVLENGPRTSTAILRAHDDWKEHFDRILGAGAYRFMCVPQGKTFEEFEECAVKLQDIDNNAMWGIPRNLVKLHGSRERATVMCHELCAEWDIHLLGFSDDLRDDMYCAHFSEVGGIDSAVPIRAASIHRPFALVAEGHELPPRGNWWDDAKWDPMMAANLRQAQEIFS